MSRLPTDPAELDALAGEYVLGTVDARMARLIAGSLATDAALAGAVRDWEARLAPLTLLATPESPPVELWPRIERMLSPAAPPALTIVSRATPRFLRLWQGWAVGASLAAVALAAIAFLPGQAAPRMMTVLVSDASQTAWTAEVDRKGGLRLASLPTAAGATYNTAPEGHQLELWGLPPGATAPTSLGLVPRGGGQVSIAAPAVRPVAGMLIMISLEPPGGAPGSAPTGPVLFIGRLSEAGPPP